MKNIKKILAVLLACMLALALFGACGKEEDGGDDAAATSDNQEGGDAVSTPWKSGDPYPVVTMTIDDYGAFEGGVITAELYPDVAPNTVHNFISLIKDGFYEGKVFHRAVPDFMIQGGSLSGDGMSSGFPYAINGEFAKAGFTQNDLPHTRGVLSTARTNDLHSASTQFFIIHENSYNSSSLDGGYAAFGLVTDGMDVVDRIAELPCGGPQGDSLITKPKIASITVDTFGVEYPAPITHPAQ